MNLSVSAVSIPNGMEFYQALSQKVVPKARVSIPNGMEFYREIAPFLTDGNKKFQFPTGWNSTLTWACRFDCSCPVSIPNGMEFYVNKLYECFISDTFQFPTGWNSTLCNFVVYSFDDVSIPNGMEFYPLGFEIYILIFCFNSQRDGILPIMKFCIPPAVLFQFPTGWNSTIFGIIEISF